MTKVIRQIHTKERKFKAAISMVRGNKTVPEISKEFGVHASVLHRWKKELMEKGPSLFDRPMAPKDPYTETAMLQRKIGELTVELDFLKQALKG